jgi:hypothetical protein
LIALRATSLQNRAPINSWRSWRSWRLWSSCCCLHRRLDIKWLSWRCMWIMHTMQFPWRIF